VGYRPPVSRNCLFKLRLPWGMLANLLLTTPFQTPLEPKPVSWILLSFLLFTLFPAPVNRQCSFVRLHQTAPAHSACMGYISGGSMHVGSLTELLVFCCALQRNRWFDSCCARYKTKSSNNRPKTAIIASICVCRLGLKHSNQLINKGGSRRCCLCAEKGESQDQFFTLKAVM
jgi:hypothetical protein